MRYYKRKTKKNISLSLQDNLRAAAAVAIPVIKKRSIRGVENIDFGHVKLYRVLRKLKDRLIPWCKTRKGLKSVPR